MSFYALAHWENQTKNFNLTSVLASENEYLADTYAWYVIFFIRNEFDRHCSIQHIRFFCILYFRFLCFFAHTIIDARKIICDSSYYSTLDKTHANNSRRRKRLIDVCQFWHLRFDRRSVQITANILFAHGLIAVNFYFFLIFSESAEFLSLRSE